mmetsp:Transcript_41169/g.126871  ORF Transcript_41169/g.126871 Transcript_41169/m.126871 type:complete len:82 (-) Transcript_41169:503-748(-)
MAAAKEALTQAVLLPLRHPASFAAAPLRLRSGALLHGPPGCGKTLLARGPSLDAAESGPPPLPGHLRARPPFAMGGANFAC